MDDEAQPLATSEQLAERLSFDMDGGETREADRALEELSDEARYYGSENWVDPDSTPRQVKTLVLKAAARHMKNYEGVVTSRAGDETLTFSDTGSAMGDAHFTAEERKRISELGGNYRSTFHSVGLYAYQRKPRRRGVDPACTVPVMDYGRSFPMYGDPSEPW